MKLKQISWLMIFAVTGTVLIAACSPSPPEPPVAQAQKAEPEEHMEDEVIESHNDKIDEQHKDASDAHEEETGHMDEGMANEHAEVPHEFEDLTNPFAGDFEAIAAGQAIFETNCATCHGTQGKGDGPAAAELDPKPADLSDSQMMGMLTDGYLFWRVSEGGQMEPFNSAMPPWKVSLSEEQRWQAISYVRSFTGSMPGHMVDDEHHEEEGAQPMEEEHHEEESAQPMEEEHHEEESAQPMEEEHHEEESK